MSIALMSIAWKSELKTTPKFILIALCDHANDDGTCYPSIALIAKKCSLRERAVFMAINALEELKIIHRENRSGRSTIYHIDSRAIESYRADPCTICTPAQYAPLHNMHPTPAYYAPPPLHNMHPTPAYYAPITINEPSVESSVESSIEKTNKKDEPKNPSVVFSSGLENKSSLAENPLSLENPQKPVIFESMGSTGTNLPVDRKESILDTKESNLAAIEPLSANTNFTPATKSGAACVVMRSEGLANTNPSNQKLLALLAAGATPDYFSRAAQIAVRESKGFAYALGIVANELKDKKIGAKLGKDTSSRYPPTFSQELEKTTRELRGLPPREENNEQRSGRTFENLRDVTP